MQEKKYVPIQCLYFPYGIFELATYFAKRFIYYPSRSDSNENSIKHENVESIVEPNEIDSYDSEEESQLDKVTTRRRRCKRDRGVFRYVRCKHYRGFVRYFRCKCYRGFVRYLRRL